MAPGAISPEVERRKKLVGINAETVTNVTSTDIPGHYPGEDHAWNLPKFASNFNVTFHKNEPYDASFSLEGIDASLANAFRRILLAEIPTLAIETVFVHNNTSIVQDEVLAARLGLVPLTGARAGLEWLRYEPKKPASIDDDAGHGEVIETQSRDNNTVVLKLQVECTWNEERKKDNTDANKIYKNNNVYAKDLQFIPLGRQQSRFPDPDGMIKPVNPDILLAKMRPGQCIDIDMHAIKGIGADHAKFSPVATATYRLLPTIDITSPILGNDARKFARCFPKGVIGLKEVTQEESDQVGSPYEGMKGEKKAVVQNVMRDTVSRECLRHEEFAGKVKLGRVRDHFIFSVESVGQSESDLLFLESVKILQSKCKLHRRNVANLLR